jgi:hypothetical protein
MKTKLFLTTCLVAVLMCFSQQTQAQRVFNDTMMVFNNLITWGGDVATFKPGAGGIIAAGNMSPISASLAKKLVLPRAVKTTNRPLVLQHKGNCYQFECDAAAGCGDNCQLAWLDRNGDSKVQPRQELRCVCRSGKVCKIKVAKVSCR